MHVLAGLDLGGVTQTEGDELSVGQGAIGDVAWGPTQLLRDLEQRLGLPFTGAAHAVRVARYASRMVKGASAGRYYAQSFAVDPLGTAASVLALRDLLVEAGWTGRAITAGGDRLEALHELELDGEDLPAGEADRVAAVAVELSRTFARPYVELAVIEPISSWSTSWQAVFRALARAGTDLTTAAAIEPNASPDTDLGRLQRALSPGHTKRAVELRGDGSFNVITASTSWLAAQAAPGVLAGRASQAMVVIREHDASALDNVLTSTGARSQGLRSASAWRSVLQVLPLALELAFEPKDPYRVLELLTLPIGPFNGGVGHSLARALGQSPGIGSPVWEETKQRLLEKDPERAAAHLARIAEWLEARTVEAHSAAPIATLLSVVERVRSWLVARIQSSATDRLLLAAARQAAELRAALESDPRPSLSLVQVRKLAESVLAGGVAAELLRERAGRAGLVDSPSRLRSVCDAVMWWSFSTSRSGTRRLPWRAAELAALSAADLRFPSPAQRLADQAAAARSAFCCAKVQLTLVMPGEHAGQAQSHHPLWDELLTSAQLDERAMARVTMSALELRDPTFIGSLSNRPALLQRALLALPGGHAEWLASPAHITPIERFSPASLEALLGCPLEWALRYRAGLRPGGHGLPPLYLLNGTLGHRLVELLHADGAFALDDDGLRARAVSRLEILFQNEGAILLRAGMGFERAQLQRQLVSAAVELSGLLRTSKLRLVAVEKAVDVPWQEGKLEGRIDLLVTDENGDHAVIDMKSGMSTYRELLRTGHALQLAAYAFAVAQEHGATSSPDAGYFSLKRGKLFGLASRSLPHADVVSGPSLSDTWQRVERSVERALPIARQGKFAATGVRRAVPLLTTLDVSEAETERHFALPAGARCKYCRYDALCGRRWEALQ